MLTIKPYEVNYGIVDFYACIVNFLGTF